MTPEETELMMQLCARIKEEKDPKIFDDLVKQLNDLIEIKHNRIHPTHARKTPST